MIHPSVLRGYLFVMSCFRAPFYSKVKLLSLITVHYVYSSIESTLQGGLSVLRNDLKRGFSPFFLNFLSHFNTISSIELSNSLSACKELIGRVLEEVKGLQDSNGKEIYQTILKFVQEEAEIGLEFEVKQEKMEVY